jgi:hypothetical protein
LALKARLASFGRTLHETRPIEFGRFGGPLASAARRVAARDLCLLGFTHYCGRTSKWLVHREAQDVRETPDVQADGVAPGGLAGRRIGCCLRRRSQTSRRMGSPEFETLMAHFRLPTHPRVALGKSRVRECRMRIRRRKPTGWLLDHNPGSTKLLLEKTNSSG